MKTYALSIFLLAFLACGNKPKTTQLSQYTAPITTPFKPGNTVATRFELPNNCSLDITTEKSFENYLQQLPLKAQNSPVMLHSGEQKWNQDVAAAVIDLPIGKRDLHQCADGIMHLKARYHYQKKEFDKIGFHFVNGFYCDFEHWKNGYRVSVKGSKSYWYKAAQPDSSEKTFWKYLEMVFAYAGTLSLEKELKPVDFKNLKIGDVFIQGGSPGHAVIVVNTATDSLTHHQYFMLAQSYMPAQELHILKNFNNEGISPWYKKSEIEYTVITPEWSFTTEELKQF